MLSLDDEEDLIPERPVGLARKPAGRSFSLRPLLTVLAVAILGGGLGAGAYWLANLDTKDLIAMLDISDQPHLSLELPGRPATLAPPENGIANGAPGPLLTPPGAPPAGAGSNLGAMTPPPPMPDHAPVPQAAVPPAEPGKAAATQAPPAAEPPPAPAAMPQQPLPRDPAQPPTYASLTSRLTDPKPLPAAPVDSLLRQSPHGPLPVIAKDGRQPWRVYARPFDAPASRPRIAVVIAGLGLDRDATEAAITKLPADVTLAFSPYAGNLESWLRKARAAGHEVLLMLPAETEDFPSRDPGPWGLLEANSAEENLTRLEQVLGRAAGYTGMLAPNGGFTASPKLGPVLGVLRERGLLYVGGGAKPDSGPPVAAVTAQVEEDLFRDAIEARLTGAARAAKTDGQGVVVVAPKPVTFDRLVGWLDKLTAQGIVLAPVSAVVKQTGKS